MARPVSDSIHEAQVAGKLIRGVGPIITLSIAVLVLTAALTFSMLTAKAGADRWTATDQMQYQHKHDLDRAKLVDSVLADHTKKHKEEASEYKQTAQEVTEIHEDLAVLKSTVARMEGDLKIIKTAVVSMERSGNGGN